MSLINILNNGSPITKPCGIAPNVTGHGSSHVVVTVVVTLVVM